jgi:FtsH-binding integral membrane protein
MSQNGWETTIYTGDPATDQRTVEQQRQAAAAQGLDLQVQPLQSGGFHVRAVPRAMGYGGQPAYAMPGSGGGAVVVGGQAAVGAKDTPERLAYIRKVYSLLALSAFAAIAAGWAGISLGGTRSLAGAHGRRVVVPAIVDAMLTIDAHGIRPNLLSWVAFGALFVAIMGASAVSRVKGLNVVALLGVSILLGVEIAPMVFVANYAAGFGHTLSAAPVRDTFTLVGAIFAGITAYVYITRKDFSFLGASLSMGFFVVFGACILAAIFHSEVFSLAVATVGALLAAGFLLYNTSRIFRTSDFSDPVGDALGLVVQLRNLFMFILRILMSSRR